MGIIMFLSIINVYSEFFRQLVNNLKAGLLNLLLFDQIFLFFCRTFTITPSLLLDLELKAFRLLCVLF
jgi:hypothetical protein